MGNIFKYKNKVILNVNNSFWDSIHSLLVKIVKEKDIKNSELEQFLLDTDQEVYGYGCVGKDLHYYFLQAESRILLASLLDEVIQLGVEEENFCTIRVSFIQEFKDALLAIDEH